MVGPRSGGRKQIAACAGGAFIPRGHGLRILLTETKHLAVQGADDQPTRGDGRGSGQGTAGIELPLLFAACQIQHVQAPKEIRAATEEQSTGNEQVVQGVEGMREMMQQNAQSAAELASSAEKLSRESSLMCQSVARFQVR